MSQDVPPDPRGAPGLRMRSRLSVSFLFSIVALGIGFANQLLISARFGTSSGLDGYWIAVALVNVLGFYAVPLRDATVPVFHDVLGSQTDAARFASAAVSLSLLLGLSGGLLLAVCIVTGQPASLLGPPGKASQLGAMLVWLLPAAILVATTEVLAGLLVALDMVVRQAVLRLVPPVATCLSLVLLGGRLGIHALPVALVASSVATVAIAVHALAGRGFRIRLTDPRHAIHPKARRMFATLVIVYVFAQLHVLLERAVFARAGAGVVSAFQYAAAPVTALIGFLSGPLSSALWPRFLRLHADGDDARLAALLGNLMIFMGLPLAVACIFVFFNSGSIVHVLYSRGDFGTESTRITATALAFLIFTAVPACLSQVVGRLLNAQGNHRAMGMVSLAMAGAGMTLLTIGGSTGNYAVAMIHWFVANTIGAVLTLYLAYNPVRAAGSRLTTFARGGVQMAAVLGVALLVVPRVEFQESKVSLLLQLTAHFALYAGISGVAFALVYRKRILGYMGRSVPA